MAVFLSQQQ